MRHMVCILFILFQLACASTSPPCPYSEYPEEASIGPSAGCFIVNQSRLLVVRDAGSGKLGFPAGHAEPGESLACTAFRETYEETGFRVDIEKLLRRYENGFALFECSIYSASPVQHNTRVPDHARAEILELRWIDPYQIEAHEWRFPAQLTETRNLFSRQ